MKQCFKCLQTKPLSDFYKHPKMPDGHVNKCKDCNKSDIQDNYKKNILKPGFIDKQRKRGRDKYRRLYEGTGKANPERNERWENRYPEKKPATNAASKLSVPFRGAERHHWSYNKEHYLDVIFLTKRHHMKAHRFLVYDQEQMMYRRFDTNELLDTKERHESFIKYCISTYED